jgi:Flp pilus assembly protein TadB
MAKERAQRRAEREREIAARAADRTARAARDARRQALVGRLRGLFPAGRSRPTGVLAARRRARNRVLLAVAGLVQIAAWFLGRSFAISALVLVFTLLTGPVLSRLLFDR